MAKERTEEKVYDIRLVERQITNGGVHQKDYDKFLKALPDLQDKAISSDLESPED